MGGFFASVRPYPRGIRQKVFTFAEALGFRLGEGWLIEARTPDARAAAFIESIDPDLVILPFHLHRDVEGTAVDGIGVATLLSSEFAIRRIPLLMPVSVYSYSAGFFGRLADLEQKRPEIAGLVVPMCESQIAAPEVIARMREIHQSSGRSSVSRPASSVASSATSSVTSSVASSRRDMPLSQRPGRLLPRVLSERSEARVKPAVPRESVPRESVPRESAPPATVRHGLGYTGRPRTVAEEWAPGVVSASGAARAGGPPETVRHGPGYIGSSRGETASIEGDVNSQTERAALPISVSEAPLVFTTMPPAITVGPPSSQDAAERSEPFESGAFRIIDGEPLTYAERRERARKLREG